METYNVEHMALLNSLIYYKVKLQKETKISDVINDYLEENPDLENIVTETRMSKDKANKVLMAIKNDEELSSLRIIKSSLGVEEKDGPVHVCLVNEEKKEAIFLYRGTNDKEWLDNGEGFIKESSQLQKNALNFFEKTMKDNHLKEHGYHITVTGHSKGANKAQYVAIKNPDVDVCYSFDGQGFSKEFVTKNEKLIAERCGKIKAYAAHKDYVSVLGIQIAKKVVLYKTNKPHEYASIKHRMPLYNRGMAHAMSSMFNFQSGQFQMNETTTKRALLSVELNVQSVNMMEQLPLDKQAEYFKGVMGALQCVFYKGEGEPIHEDDRPNTDEIKKGVLGTIGYFAKHGASHAATYAIGECLDTFKDKIPLHVQQKLEMELENTEVEVQENGLPKDNIEGELVQENAKELKKDQLETEETEVSQNEDKGRPMSLCEWQIKIDSEKASTITAPEAGKEMSMAKKGPER